MLSIFTQNNYFVKNSTRTPIGLRRCDFTVINVIVCFTQLPHIDLIKVKIAKGWTLLIAMIRFNLCSTGHVDKNYKVN